MLLNTPICDFGWQAPEFTLPDTDNQLHELDGLVGSNGLLVAFICNHCPYVRAIIDRLVSDATPCSTTVLIRLQLCQMTITATLKTVLKICWLSLLVIRFLSLPP